MDLKLADALIISAAENSNTANLEKLLTALGELNAANADLAVLGDSLTLLWEAWENQAELEAPQCRFATEAARLRLPESATFRQLLADAVKAQLPPYLGKIGVLRALGLRENNVGVSESIRRFDRLRELKTGLRIFIVETGRWGLVNNIDTLNASVSVSLYDGGALAVTLEKALSGCLYFTPDAELNRLLDRGKLPAIASSEFRAIAKNHTVFPLSDNALRNLAERLLVPALMTRARFETWYAEEKALPVATISAATVRTAGHSRGLKEMELLLDREIGEGQTTIDATEVQAYHDFFTRLKPEIAQRDSKLLAGIVSRLGERTQAAAWATMLQPLTSKAAFWPVDPRACTLDTLGAWGELPVKQLESLVKVTAAVFAPEYRALLAVRLPLRCLNSYCNELSDELLDEVFTQVRDMSSDVLLWCWKNRKRCSDELQRQINMENVINALGQLKLPKAWLVAQRDLKTHLMDKKDFQAHLVKVFATEVSRLTGAIAGGTMLDSGERQSLLVKLAHHSEALRALIEGGIGGKLIAGGSSATTQSAPPEPVYTSLASHRRLVAELHDVINVQQPENREALKTARAHGDFRENAEFDAAKERRNFLTRRRNELERIVNSVQGVNFRQTSLAKHVDLGSTVTLEYSDGSREVYYLLGAWDGNPEKHYLSYKTKLGELLRNKPLGAVLELPDGRQGKVESFEALPEEVLRDLE